jgi:GT2 family glycosyltransferase
VGGELAKHPACAIVLLNWNGSADTCQCLDSLAAIHGDDFCVIVVDNGSTDGSFGQIQQHCMRSALQRLMPGGLHLLAQPGLPWCASAKRRSVHLVQAGENGGFAKGNNIGIRQALAWGMAHIWVLNNDTVVQPDALACLLLRAAQHTRLGMVGSVLVYEDKRVVVQAFGGATFMRYLARGRQIGHGLPLHELDIQALLSERLDYVAGASMLLRADMVRQVGLLDERFFLYFEEFDWAHRARRMGWVMGTAEHSIVFHKEGASIGTATRTARSLMSEFYLARNLLLLYRKHFPALLPIAVLRNLREAAAMLLRGDRDRSRTVLRATLAGALGRWGMADSSAFARSTAAN